MAPCFDSLVLDTIPTADTDTATRARGPRGDGICDVGISVAGILC